jgi:hypothetical protein
MGVELSAVGLDQQAEGVVVATAGHGQQHFSTP